MRQCVFFILYVSSSALIFVNLITLLHQNATISTEYCSTCCHANLFHIKMFEMSACVLCLSFQLNICCVLFGLPVTTFPVDWSRLEAPVWLVGEAGNIRLRAAGSPWGHTILIPPAPFDVYFLCNIKSRLNMFSHWCVLSLILLARH